MQRSLESELQFMLTINKILGESVIDEFKNVASFSVTITHSVTHIHLTRSLLSICGLDCSRLSKKRTKFMFHYIIPAVICKVIY